MNTISALRLFFLLSIIHFFSCANENTELSIDAYRETRTISYNNINVDVVIDKPALNQVDVLLVFHGTVLYDLNLMTAANTTLDKFKSVLDRNDMMIVSVAYPQENILLGDCIIQCEAMRGQWWGEQIGDNDYYRGINRPFFRPW